MGRRTVREQRTPERTALGTGIPYFAWNFDSLHRGEKGRKTRKRRCLKVEKKEKEQ